MEVNLSFISGVSIGIELATKEEIAIPGASWGLAIDFVILRLTIIFYNSNNFV